MGEEKTYSISGLNRAIAGLFARHTPGRGFWVRGDVQRLTTSRAGHCYFELVERDAHRREPRAVAAAVLWSYRRQEVEQVLGRVGLELAEDLSVRVKVRVTFYETSGKVQLEVLDIDPSFTAGDLALAREQVRRALRAAGVFDANHRLPVPLVPLRVALVTSGGSAAWHDFTHELRGSGFAFAVELFDTRVAGPGAAGELAAAVRRAGAGGDVMVIVRGGGARSELTAFDSEPVAFAVASAGVPVWMGVGHEIDRSICDEVAQRCYKTPTAAAQALVDAVRTFAGSLDVLQNRLGTTVRRRLAGTETAIDKSLIRLRGGVEGLVARRGADMDRCALALAAAPSRRLTVEETKLDGLAAQARAFDPARVLARGYSITRDADGRVVLDGAVLAPGDRITTELAAGRAVSVVEEAEGAGDHEH
ncbi:MAG: exodeoxyribonuclease VII large subunit [Acidimicrobiia bacterium]